MLQVDGNLVDTRPFVLWSQNAVRKEKAVLKQDAARDAVLAPYTLLAVILATGKYVPYTAADSADGSSVPAGIYLGGAIPFADIVAGDVTDLPVVVSGIQFDEDMLVIEGDGITLDTPIEALAVGDESDVTSGLGMTLRDYLIMKNMIPVKTESLSSL